MPQMLLRAKKPRESNRVSTSPTVTQDKTQTRLTSNQKRAARLKALPIEYIGHASFRHPEHSESLLAMPFPPSPSQDAPPHMHTAYIAGLYEIQLLTALDEERLFSLMNLLYYKAEQLQQSLSLESPSVRQMDQLERFLLRATQVRNHIIRANLRLVVALAKKFAMTPGHLEELVSEGHLPLIRAVELFDFSRGNRFSTYATWAIRNHFLRHRKETAQLRERFNDGEPSAIENATDERASWQTDETQCEARQALVNGLLAQLSQREREIVQARFGLNGQQSEQTLLEIGNNIGLSKERVRQLATRALKKLATFAQSMPVTQCVAEPI